MKNIEVYISILFMLVGGVVLWQSSLLPYHSEFGPGAGLLPTWISVIMIVLCLLNIVIALKRDNTHLDEILPTGTSLKNVLACIGSYALFMIIVPYAGFSISSVLMLFILFSRGFRLYWALVWSVSVTVTMFIVFNSFLGVPLPFNEFGW